MSLSSGGNYFNGNDPASSTRIDSSSETPRPFERSVTPESRSGSTTPSVGEKNALQDCHNPLAMFPKVSDLLINGLLELTKNFMEKSLIHKNKTLEAQENEKNDIAGALFAKQNVYNKLGGLIARSDYVFENTPLTAQEEKELATLKLTQPGHNLETFFEKEKIKKFIQAHVAEKYRVIFIGDEKDPTKPCLLESVFKLVELLARPIEVLEHEKKVASANKRPPRISEVDLSVNTAKNSINQLVQNLTAEKGSTTKAGQISAASGTLLNAIKVINIIYAEKGKESVAEEKESHLRDELHTLNRQDEMQKEQIANLQSSIGELDARLQAAKTEITTKTADLAQMTDNVANLTVELKEAVNALNSEKAEYVNDIKEKANSIKSLEKTIKEMQIQAENQRHEITSLTSQSNLLLSEQESKNGILANMISKNQALEVQLNQMKLQMSELEKRNKELNDETVIQAETIKSSQNEIHKLQREQRALEISMTNKSVAYATLESNYGNVSEDLAKKRDEITRLETLNCTGLQEVKALQEKLAFNTEALIKLQKEKQTLIVALSQNGDASEEVAQQNIKLANEHLTAYIAELEAIKRERTNLESQIEALTAQARNQNETIAKLSNEKETVVTENQELKQAIQAKDIVISTLQVNGAEEAKDSAPDAILPSPAANVVSQEAYNKLLAENAALRQHITSHNSSIHSHLAHMRTAFQSNRLKWLGFGLLALAGIALMATGFGALAGIGILAGVGYAAAIAMTVAGATAVAGTVAKVGFDAMASKQSTLQDIDSVASNLNEPVIEIHVEDAPQSIQHIDHMLGNRFTSEDVNASQTATLTGQNPAPSSTISFKSIFASLTGSNKVAPAPIESAKGYSSPNNNNN